MNTPREDLADRHNGSFDRLFREYVDRLNRGEGLDKDEIRARHRNIAGRLIHELESYESFGGRLESEAPLGTLGDYTLRRQIGRGGMGVVYDAWQNSMDRRVALKVLPAGIAADRHACARFMREAQTAGHLSHPNVVSVHAMGVDENTPYYAMEYVEGETLAQIIARLKHLEPEAQTVFGHKDGAGYFENLARAFADVADGLQHAHSRRVIHRDIKPSNLILDTEGDRGGSPKPERSGGRSPKLRILDFGLAHLEGHASLTASGDVVGTPLYMSPEQARKRKIPVDHRTDVYSLGATMYEMLTMRPPFRGKDNADTLSQIIERDPTAPRKVNPRVPRDLETIVLKCLRKAAGDRYGTAEAVGQDLRRFVRSDPIEARPQGGWERLLARVKRHRTKLLVAAAFLVVLLGATALKLQRDYARNRAELAEYESRVLDVLTRIYRREFSLKTVVGQAQDVFGRRRTESTLRPVVPDDFKALRASGETDPVVLAVRALKEVADAPPERPDAHYHLAKAYRLLERVEEARTELQRALGCDADFVPAKVLDLELADRDQNSPEYAAIWGEYGERGDWRQWWLEAQRRMKEESWSQAATAYGELIALWEDGKEPYIGSAIEAHIGRGVARLESRDYLGAQRDFQSACTLASGFAEGTLLLGKSYYLLGRAQHADDWTNEAEEMFEGLHAEAMLEENDEVALWIAAIYDSLGEYAKGLDWVERNLEVRSLSMRLKAYFFFRTGNTTKAIEILGDITGGKSRDPLAHYILGLALYSDLMSRPGRDREYSAMIEVLERAVALKPEYPPVRQLLELAEGERRALMNGPRTTWITAWAVATLLSGTAHAQQGFFDNVTSAGPPLEEGFIFQGSVSRDGLTFYFSSHALGGGCDYDLYTATRAATTDEHGDPIPFDDPVPIEELNTPALESCPAISASGLTIYFSRRDAGDTPGLSADIWIATRAEEDEPFGDPRPLEAVNSSTLDQSPSVTEDELMIFFMSTRPEWEHGIWVATRDSVDDPFGAPGLVEGINTGWSEWSPVISADGLTLFFSSDRPGGLGLNDIWMATRERSDHAFGEPVPLGAPADTPLNDAAAAVSWDWPAAGSFMAFAHSLTGGFRCQDLVPFYLATWHLDCNGNGVDDSEDIASGDAEDVNANDIPDECEVPRFRRGDANADGNVDVADATYTLNWLFAGGPEPGCRAAANTNGDDRIDIGDPVSTLTFLFGGGPAPYAPYPDCGPGASEADMKLGCETPPSGCAVP